MGFDSDIAQRRSLPQATRSRQRASIPQSQPCRPTGLPRSDNQDSQNAWARTRGRRIRISAGAQNRTVTHRVCSARVQQLLRVEVVAQLGDLPRRRVLHLDQGRRRCSFCDVSDPVGPERFRRLGDEELIRLAAELDAEAFEELYERYHESVFSLAVRIVTSSDRAQDITHKAFLNLWRDAGQYDPERGLVRTWLMTMVHNLGIDAVRQRSGHERDQADAAILRSQPAGRGVTSEQTYARGHAQSIRDALEGLAEDQRQIIELAYFGGRTQSEIAEMLELPLAKVKSQARLGLIKLRDALRNQHHAPP